MELITTAIETTGIIDAQHRLLLDEALPLANKSRVRVIVLVTKELPKKDSSTQAKDYVNKLAGLHKEVWQDIDIEDYLKQEREAWR